MNFQPTGVSLPANVLTMTPQQLGAMTAEQLAGLLQQVNGLRDQANAKVIQAETQIQTVETHLQQLQQTVQEQFQVGSLEELDGLIAKNAEAVAEAFASLNALVNPPQQQAVPAAPAGVAPGIVDNNHLNAVAGGNPFFTPNA